MSERASITAKTPEAKSNKPASKSQGTDFSQSTNSPADHILFLQRTVGNQAVQRLFTTGTIQPKIRIGQPNDIYEQEADRVADEVMRMPENTAISHQHSAFSKLNESVQTKPLKITPLIQRQMDEEEETEQETVQTKPLINHIGSSGIQRQTEEGEKEEDEAVQTKQASGYKPPITGNMQDASFISTTTKNDTIGTHLNLSSRIQFTGDSGENLSHETRGFFESRFGCDFNKVRLHNGSDSALAAQSINAKAFTLRNDIVFGTGQYNLESYQGKKLLAHELTHVLQQEGGDSGFQVGRTPEAQIQRDVAAEELISSHTSWGNLDEEGLGGYLLRLVRRDPTQSSFVQEVLNTLGSTDRDDVSFGFASQATDNDLLRLARSAVGRALLERLYDELTSGSIWANEQEQANRILVARGQTRPVEEAAEQLLSGRVLTFPFRLPGVTVLNDAPISARRIGGGRIRVSMPYRVAGMSMFREETRTLPTEVFMAGHEIDADQMIRIKLYDEGGTIVYRPALYLIELSNRTTSRVWENIGTSVAIGLTFGLGSAGVAGGAAARGVSLGARAVVFLDRASIALFLISTVVRDHRGWIIQHFGEAGRHFVNAVEIASGLAAVYGLGRIVLSAPRVIANLRNAWRSWRESRAFQRMIGSDRGRADRINRATEQFLNNADEAVATPRRARTPESPRAATSASTSVRPETLQRISQMEINGARLSQTEAQAAARTFEMVEREVASAGGAQANLQGYYIPAGPGQRVANPELGMIVSRPFEVSGPAYPDISRCLVVVGREAVRGTSVRGIQHTLRTIIRHEVGEVLEMSSAARWPRFGDIGASHWRSSARGALLPGTTRAEKVILLRDARALEMPDSVGRALARRMGIEAEIFGSVSIGRPPIIPPPSGGDSPPESEE